MGAVCGKKESPIFPQKSEKLKAEPQQKSLRQANKEEEASVKVLEKVEEEEEESLEQKLFSNVILSARNALSHLETFGDDFVEKNFHSSFHPHHMTWVDMRYEWFVPYEEVR